MQTGLTLNNGDLNWITNNIWAFADGVLREFACELDNDVSTHLYGQEINTETST